ncbi:uncharacterized protein Larp4B isoform X4 [Panulirus ornatus]|uniref:uncharacterized protein Larp4B isoform X4 n=1 Tax=Panulirus ornatus TaxID=150431 RepID=UPI003A851991
MTRVSAGGGAVLNPEASVFHLPPALHAAHTPPTPSLTPTPHHHHPTINGFHSHVYPFMNGDVAKQYCGVCPPTPETPGLMAVESLLGAPTSSPSTLPVEAGTTSGQPPGKTALVSKKSEDMAAAAQNNEKEGNAKSSTPLSTSQQNGEVSPESSKSSASPLPTPVPTLPSSSRSDVDNEDNKEQEKNEEQATESKKKGHLTSSETQGTQTTPAQTPTPSTPAVTPPAQPQQSIQQTQPPTRDQIKQLVAQQVEYFFSRENLSNDPYLISQMDSDQYVPVFILANCSQFKNITKDHSIIVEALKESPFVQLDEENNRVRPNYKRCIVILREIPESTPVEDIESMFKSEECPKMVSCEFVHNSSWYVTFESDEDAQKAYWYLRGVVKTFKDKPILARIKTKPISRLGCLSVLPSYGNKGGGDGKEGSGPPSNPGSAALQGAPGTPAPTSTYNNPGNQRFMYSTPSVSANSYTYSYTAPTTQMPTAFFYPNMLQWTPPGGFYDMSSFLQFNGLSPQAAFKPQTNHNIRYPNSRRNSKHRDGGRFDKSDNRQNNGAGQNSGGNSNSQVSHPGHYHPSPRPHPSHHRPQAAQSPSQSAHRVSQPPATSTSAPTPPPPPPPPPPPQPPTSVQAAVGGNNNDSFAHSDFSIASQSSLYTSFSPPMGPTPPVIQTEKKEVVTVSKASSSSSSTLPVSSQSLTQTVTSTSSPPSSSTSVLSSSTTEAASPPIAASVSPPASASVTTTSSSSQAHPVHQQINPPSQHVQPSTHRHQHPYQHMQQQPSGPPPHRTSYVNDHYHHHHPHHMQRDPQQPRQFFENWYYHRSRGMRRRPRGREEEAALTGGGRGVIPQRGGGSQPPNTDSTKLGGSHQEMTPPPPPPPPQFDLEAAAFPPLPGSDEPVPVAEEKRPSEPLQSAWGGDTQRFSDVMKGTAKPRPTSQSSLGDKELAQEPSTPTSSNSPSPATTVTASPTVPAVQTFTAATPQTSQASCTLTTSPSMSLDAPSIAPSTASPNSLSTCTAAPTSVPLTTLGNTSVSSSSSSSSNKPDLRIVPRDQRGAREDRRPGASGGPRDRREYIRDHPRDYQRDHQRDVVRSSVGRDRDYRLVRENNLRTGKENRPVPPRSWKEDKVDADGWITKVPKESRSHREMNREQWERPDTREVRTQHLVNGDTSPPPSPNPQKTDTKTPSEESCVDETKVTTSQPLNNNDGEHKTSWAKMAWASKEQMERLAAELKEKEEQEKIKKQRLSTRPQFKFHDRVLISRDRDGKPMRRDGLPRENRFCNDRGTAAFRPRDSARPKSPK